MSDAPREANEILGALLWARNHIDVGNTLLRQRVVARLDLVLNKHDVGVKDTEAFRKAYPAQ